MGDQNFKKRILVIDDETNMRHMLAAVLKKADYIVDVASDGSVGLQLIEQDQYDFILCDIKMPNMGGMEFLEASRDRLGGISDTAWAGVTILAAAFDRVFVETVGVGQSETMVADMVDFFLLIMLAGAGDELQGIKRGIMEMADAIVINKADGGNLQKARRAQAEFTNALHLFPPSGSGWTPLVKTCSSLHGSGISEIWDMLGSYRSLVSENGHLDKIREEQAKYWMYETIREGIYHQVLHTK